MLSSDNPLLQMIFTTLILDDVTNWRYKALTLTMKSVFIADTPIEQSGLLVSQYNISDLSNIFLADMGASIGYNISISDH